MSGTTGASASAKAFSGVQDGAGKTSGLMGLFAALLNNLGGDTTASNVPPGLSPDKPGNLSGEGLAGLFRMTLANASGDAGNGDAEDPDAVAGLIDVPTPILDAVDPAPMVNFIEALGALRTSLDQGEPLAPELLDKVDAALNELAEALGLEIEALPVPEDFAALLDQTDADQSGLAGALTLLLGPLAQSIATAQPATDTDAIVDAPAASAQLKVLGDKLAALLGSLEEQDVPPEKLAALGMTPDQPLDSEIEAALNRFMATQTGQTAAAPEEPELALPSLKLAEPVLGGSASDTLDAPEKSDTTARSQTLATSDETGDAAGRPSDHDKGNASNMSERARDRSEAAARDARGPASNAAPTAFDASSNASPSAEAAAQQQPSGARVDATANPRIIQAGYQTSQQQLNLPQIAFELARQVQYGNTRFQIRLDPPELGRIDVRLDIDQSGQVNARLTVEKSETLDLMQRDQRGLERALQQAGLDGAKTNLEFSLKQNPFAGQQGQMGDGKDQNGAPSVPSANDNGLTTAEGEENPPMVNLYRVGLQASGVNIIA